jgi:hypothetical protein
MSAYGFRFLRHNRSSCLTGALKLWGAVAAIKTDPFPFKRPPHPDGFKVQVRQHAP